MDFTTRNSMTI